MRCFIHHFGYLIRANVHQIDFLTTSIALTAFGISSTKLADTFNSGNLEMDDVLNVMFIITNPYQSLDVFILKII